MLPHSVPGLSEESFPTPTPTAGPAAGKGTAFGILSIINMVPWGLGGALTLYLLGWALRVFRGRGSAASPGSSGTAPRGRASSGGGAGGRRAAAAAAVGSRRSIRGAAAATAAPAP